MQKVEGSNPSAALSDQALQSLKRCLDKGYTFRFPELEPALKDLLGK